MVKFNELFGQFLYIDSPAHLGDDPGASFAEY